MNPERWERLKPLFHGAIEQPPGTRAAWLRGACPDDEPLRQEAQALIDAHETVGDFLEEPATLDTQPPDLDTAPFEAVPLEVGQHVGPYLIRGELGRGGMGIVYLAEDVRLGRTVALKALAPGVADDPQRRERLRREARAAAALSHPGIAVVYALEEIDGNLFIAAEHVKGRTLRAELDQGPLGVRRTLDTALDIVRALSAAHDARVVHRDLKPENILLTGDGHMKILDFGIAHVADEALTQLTRASAVLGTPAYMAPEQIVGIDVDFRVDIYAVGVLLLEMATGAHPFASTERASAALPPALQAVADRCLAKNPRDRYASTRDLLAALEDARGTFEGVPDRRTAPAFDAARSAPPLTPRWWWEFHQGMAALVYWIMLVPMWNARGLIGGLPGRTLFIMALASVIVSANLRLHLWFTSRFYAGELPWVRARATRWVTAADWVFALTLVLGGLLVGDARSALAVLLIAVGIGAALAFLVIEPVTERTAFGDGRP